MSYTGVRTLYQQTEIFNLLITLASLLSKIQFYLCVVFKITAKKVQVLTSISERIGLILIYSHSMTRNS